MTAIHEAWADALALAGRMTPAVTELWGGTAGLRRTLAELGSGFGAWLAGFDLDLPRDSAIVLSFLFLALAVPSILSAWVDRRVPRVGLLLLVAGGLLTVWTLQAYPQEYDWQDVPMAFIEVIADLVN